MGIYILKFPKVAKLNFVNIFSDLKKKNRKNVARVKTKGLKNITVTKFILKRLIVKPLSSVLKVFYIILPCG